MDLSRKSVSYTVLEREAQSNRQIYETLLQRQNELQMWRNSGGNNVRLDGRRGGARRRRSRPTSAAT